MLPQHTPSTIGIPLLNGRTGEIKAWALIDMSDLPLVNNHVWYLRSDGYAYYRSSPGRPVFMHRVLLGIHGQPRTVQGDHKNRDRLDNRRGNLRIVTHAQNRQNQKARKGSKSGQRGVSWDRRSSRWMAIVYANGRNNYFGQYDSVEEAAEVARQARLRLMPFAVD